MSTAQAALRANHPRSALPISAITQAASLGFGARCLLTLSATWWAWNGLCPPFAGSSSVNLRISYGATRPPYQLPASNNGLTREKLTASGMIPPKGTDQKVRTREAGGHLNRAKLNPGRLLIRPYALAGNPKELLVTLLCLAFLGAIFTAEIFTPDVVVGAFALLPLLAAIWVLSARMAALVAMSASVLFVLAVAIETNNRTTVILVGVAVFIPALIARLYAKGIASLLTSRPHTRPSISSWTAPPALDGVDGSALGLRSLTRRELEVARLAAEGYTAAEIGGRLNIGNRTVESHLASAYSKLRIRSRLQLMRMASRLGAAPLS